MNAILALEDGSVFEGRSFGAPGERSGEVIFNTSMTGYQEILTDPSYRGQIMTMTYPLIGNYGICVADHESVRPHVEGFVVKEYCRDHSNWRAGKSLGGFLKENGIIGIEGVDTRALTRHIRSSGVMKGTITTGDVDRDRLVGKAGRSPGLTARDLVNEVTCAEEYVWNGLDRKREFDLAVLDCGVKHNILRITGSLDCNVRVFPAGTAAERILACDPHGLLLSNGPGDPEGVPYVVDTVKEIISRSPELPVMGICLGHQILGLAFGGRTYKLKFGHRGGNQPVRDLTTGKVAITSQNHGFCVDERSLPEDEIEVTHMNLNDHTVEGIRHRTRPIFSVQYHPEAAPGPHDADYLFKRFMDMMRKNRKEGKECLREKI
jgi:carbamoyl-phosphate synthase small subunit